MVDDVGLCCSGRGSWGVVCRQVLPPRRPRRARRPKQQHHFSKAAGVQQELSLKQLLTLLEELSAFKGQSASCIRAPAAVEDIHDAVEKEPFQKNVLRSVLTILMLMRADVNSKKPE